MAIQIQMKRGVLANRPVLASGEQYYATDTKEVYVGPDPVVLGRLSNASVAPQTINTATTAILTGSLLNVPPGKLRIGTVFKYEMAVTKTAAGTAANTWHFRLGTTGTTSDPIICSFTGPTGTAVVDQGKIDIIVTIRGPLSASCVAQGCLTLLHNLTTTGLATTPCGTVFATSSAFDATAANLKATLSCTTAASTVLTFPQLIAEAVNLA